MSFNWLKTDCSFSINQTRDTLISVNNQCFTLSFSKVLRPEKLAAHLFEVDEDVEKDEVSQLIENKLTSKLSIPCVCIFTT